MSQGEENARKAYMGKLLNREEVREEINRMLYAYDQTAIKRFGPAAHWGYPVRVVGAALRNLVETLIGFAVYVKRRAQGHSHEATMQYLRGE